jgi:hypothetical protein
MRLIENFSIIPLSEYLQGNKNLDILITCGSFENRCLGSCDVLQDIEVRLKSSIIFKYPENDPKNAKEKNIKKMKAILDCISTESYIFDSASISQPSEGIKKFLSFLKDINLNLNNRNIIFDISVFTKPYFFLLLKAIKERFGMRKFHIIYTEAVEYPFDSKKNETILTEGLDRIESMPGFMGSTVNLEDALIVILGFEGKRSLEVFYAVDPEVCYCLDGYPSLQPGWHKKSIEANLRFLDESGAFRHLFFAPANDPFETMDALERIINEIKEKNSDLGITIAPLGTKIQAMGALLCNFLNKNIRIVYPFPSSFAAIYSDKYGRSWIGKIDLDRINER